MIQFLRRLLIAGVFIVPVYFGSNLNAASAFRGFYSGYLYTSISGSVSVPERPIGLVGLTVGDDGSISSSGDLSGTVSDSGAITWNTPNISGFTTGNIATGVLTATASQSQNGATTTFRIEAKNTAAGFGGSSPLSGRVEQVNPAGSLNNMNRVRFANGRFVAAGARGAIAFSDDGIRWNRYGLATTLNLIDVAFGNGIYVAVGEAGAIFTSTNGIDWTPHSQGVLGFTSVAFGNGTFLLSDFAGGLYVSMDGAAWQKSPLSITGLSSYAGLDFANGVFLLYGGSFVTLSADGKTQLKSADAGVGNIVTAMINTAKVTFGNGVYIAGGASGVAYSTDGTVWKKGTGPSSRIDAVGFGNGLLVVVDAAKNLWTSADGAQWTPITMFRTGLSSVAYGSGRFVAVGQELHASADGVTWFRPDSNHLQAALTAADWTMNRGIPQLALFYDQFSSTDPSLGPASPAPIRGFNYVAQSQVARLWFGDHGYIYYFVHNDVPNLGRGYGVAAPLTEKTLRAAAGNPNGPVVIGGDGGVLIHVSRTNISTPTFEAIPSPTSADLLSAANNIFVGSGGVILQGKDVKLKQWSQVASGSSATLRNVSQYTFEDGVAQDIYIAVGDEGTLLTSPDGGTWTKRETGTNVRLIGTAYTITTNPKRFFAAGEDGSLLESLDGAVWTKRSPLPTGQTLARFQSYRPSLFGKIVGIGEHGQIVEDAPLPSGATNNGYFTGYFTTGPGNDLNAAALGNGRWVLAGDRFTAVSSDARNFSARIQPMTFEGLAFGEGRFVGVGQGGQIATSADGLFWKFQTVVFPGKSFHAVAYGGGRFAAVGDSGLIMVSEDGLTWQDKSLLVANEFDAITWHDGKFVGVGKSGVALSSLDNGETWKTGSAGGDETGIAFGNGRFVGVGWEGWTAYSTDGTTWISKRLPSPTSAEGRPFFRRVIFTSGTFYATTFGGELYSSKDGAAWSILHSGINADVRAAAAGNGLILLGGGNQIYRITDQNSGAPVITQQPSLGSATAGQTITLAASVSGAAPLTYLWLRDGEPIQDGGHISGANTTTLTLAGIDVSDSGSYELSVQNEFGSASTLPIALAITGPPVIVAQPQDVSAALGAKVQLQVVARGTAPVHFQWRFNGQTLVDGSGLSGVTSDILVIEAVKASQEGDYDVVISNGLGAVTTAKAHLTINRPPSILIQPLSLAINGGQTFRLHVEAEGSAPLTYQWKKEGQNLASGGTISGATGPTLSISQATLQDLAHYQVVVSNPFGSVTSVVAQVNIVAPGAFRPDFAFNPTFGGAVQDIQPAGNFEYFVAADRALLKVSAAGLVNTNFALINANNTIRSIVVQGDGTVVFGGSFFQVNNAPWLYIARAANDGKLDSTFKPNANLTVKKLLQVAENKMLVGRTELGFGSGIISRFNEDGTFDTTFTQVVRRGELFDLALQSDGTIWAAGAFGLIKSSPDGLVVTSPAVATWVSVGPDNKLYISDNNGRAFNRLNADASADSSFNVTIDGHVFDMAFLPNGQLVIIGDFQNVNGSPMPAIALLESNGSLASGFQSPYTASAANMLNCVRAFADGSVLVGGTIRITTPTVQNYLQRIQVLPPSNEVPSEDPFTAWAAAMHLPVGKDALTDDADGDGLLNVVEYAFGTDPLTASASEKPKPLTVQADGKVYPAIQFTRSKSADGVTIHAETSATLDFQNPASVIETIEDLGNGLERVTARASAPLSLAGAVFLRLEVRRK